MRALVRIIVLGAIAAVSVAPAWHRMRMLAHRSSHQLRRVRGLESRCVSRARRSADGRPGRRRGMGGRAKRASARRCGRASILKSSPASQRPLASTHSAGCDPLPRIIHVSGFRASPIKVSRAARLLSQQAWSRLVIPRVRQRILATYALLALLPLYVGAGRIKNQAHWQTDVLAGWAIGGFGMVRTQPRGAHSHRNSSAWCCGGMAQPILNAARILGIIGAGRLAI